MKCPICNHPENTVISEKKIANGDAILRERKCGECGFVFNTAEKVLEYRG